jgi:ribose 5-phosphate isomerase A
MDPDEVTAAKRRAGRRAAREVEDGQVVGLGTGSTAAHAIRAIGEREVSVRGVPTSFQSRQLAIEAGIDVVELDEVDGVDLAIDGADQVAGADLLKGGGAAHAREKVVDAAADRLLVVADPRKVVDAIDDPVPVEVLPMARATVAARVEAEGGDPRLRRAEYKDGPVVTDNGNLVFDCAFGTIEEPAERARWLSGVPGVVAHGLFVGMADAVYVGGSDGVEVRRP